MMKNKFLILFLFLSLFTASCSPGIFLRIKADKAEEAADSQIPPENSKGDISEAEEQAAQDSDVSEILTESAEEAGENNQQAETPKAENLSASEAKPDNDSYKIGSGDILEIVTWKEPDFSRELLVRIDGRITFPLLDDIQAAGRTPLEVKHEIEERLKTYIENPFVTVTVKSYASQRYYILGEIAKTGAYELVKNLTVLQAFALAGGFTEWASKKEILVVRNEDGEKKIIRVNYKNIVKGRDLDQNILIKANDTIIVP
jgi:polysaccharide export outer membrane protein